MIDVIDELTAVSGEPEYRFDGGRGIFWKRVSPDEWIDLRDAAMKRELAKSGLSPKADKGDGVISPLDDRLREIEQTQRVQEARCIAGWKAGVHEMGGDLVLVPRSMKLPERKEGPWLLIAAMVESLLDGDEHEPDESGVKVVRVDQRDRWLAWMQHWAQSLYAGRPTNGLAFCLAGDPNCGKTRLSELEKLMAGGKVGKPYDWMIGREDFNKELFEASLQLIDDENANTHIEARRDLGAKLKKVVANVDLKMRGMHRDGYNVHPNWRLHFNVNLEEAALLVMPPLTPDIIDKILMLKAYTRPAVPEDAAQMEAYRARYPALSAWWDHAIAKGLMVEADVRRCWPMPMPADTFKEQERFWDLVKQELPAFVFWLTDVYAPPSQVVGGRFGVRAWQHPDIVEALQQFAPHVQLWRLIDRCGLVWRKLVRAGASGAPDDWEDVKTWTGTARQLHELLRDENNKLTRNERDKEVKGESWIGQRLNEAMRHWPSVVEFKRSGKSRTWTLHRRDDITG